MLLAAIIFLALLFYLKLRRRATHSLLHSTSNDEGGGLVEELLQATEKPNVLFVTAHPDDECMFFAPTIIALNNFCKVHVLCLSSGNHEGLGIIRRQELKQSCVMLGVPENQCTSLDHPECPDSPDKLWNSATVASLIGDYVKSNDIKKIFTFDEYGISGHRNHVAVSLGVRFFLITTQEVPVYLLRSVPLLRKYLAFLDAIFTVPFKMLLQQRPPASKEEIMDDLQKKGYHFKQEVAFPGGEDVVVVGGWREYQVGCKAMLLLQSQMVWFRWLYIVFSRYMWINGWKRLQSATEL